MLLSCDCHLESELGLWPTIPTLPPAPLGPSHWCILSFQGPRCSCIHPSWNLWPAETQTLVLLMICTCLHLRHQCHCCSKYTCAPGPRCCVNFMCTWPQAPGFATSPSDSTPDQVPRGISLARTSSHGQKKENRKIPAAPLRIPIVLATTAIHSPTHSWPQKTPVVCAKWPQLMEIHRDYTAVPSQEEVTVPSNVQT